MCTTSFCFGQIHGQRKTAAPGQFFVLQQTSMNFQTQFLGCLLLILGNFLVILYLSLHGPAPGQQPLLNIPNDHSTDVGVQCTDRPRIGEWVPPEARLTNITWILEPQLAFDTTPYLPLLDPTLPTIVEEDLEVNPSDRRNSSSRPNIRRLRSLWTKSGKQVIGAWLNLQIQLFTPS